MKYYESYEEFVAAKRINRETIQLRLVLIHKETQLKTFRYDPDYGVHRINNRQRFYEFINSVINDEFSETIQDYTFYAQMTYGERINLSLNQFKVNMGCYEFNQ